MESSSAPVEDINFHKYVDLLESEIDLDPRPRIRNIVKELQDDHGWNWPPAPPKDFEKNREMIRKKRPLLYSQVLADIASILSLITGILELSVFCGFCWIPKTFIPAIRESAEYCVLFVAVFLILGLKHVYSAAVGWALRFMKPFLIGFVYLSYPWEIILPFLGIFISAIALYGTEQWRIQLEMDHHLRNYNSHWFSKQAWDTYQHYMKCCGIYDYNDWQKHGALLKIDGKIASVPKACCIRGYENCHFSSALNETTYPRGCLNTTETFMDVLVVTGMVCMVLGMLLAILGQLSRKEASAYVGDPIHSILFEASSPPILSDSNSAARKEELLFLLDHYGLLIGGELGFEEEVRKVLEERGLSWDDIMRPKKQLGFKDVDGVSVSTVNTGPAESEPVTEQPDPTPQQVEDMMAAEFAEMQKTQTDFSKMMSEEVQQSFPESQGTAPGAEKEEEKPSNSEELQHISTAAKEILEGMEQEIASREDLKEVRNNNVPTTDELAKEQPSSKSFDDDERVELRSSVQTVYSSFNIDLEQQPSVASDLRSRGPPVSLEARASSIEPKGKATQKADHDDMV